MRTWTLPVVLLGLAASTAAASEGGMPCVEARPVESFASEIRPAGDTDLYCVELLAGARVGATVRALGESHGLRLLRVAVLDVDAETALGSRSGFRAAAVRSVVVPARGRYYVRVTGQGAGSYVLRVLGGDPRPTTVRGLVVGGDPVTHPVEALDGSLLSLDVRYRGGLVKIADLLDPAGDPVPGFESAARFGGSVNVGVLRVRRFLLGASGTYTLVLERLLGNPVVSVRTRVTMPRLTPEERRVRVLGPEEPFLTSMTPAEGGRGTALVLRGGDFPASGARVFVGGFEAGDVVVVDATELHATAPVGPEPGAHDVVLVGVDGQGDALEAAFTYLPPPTITALSPREGPLAGGIEVEFSGAGFRADVHLTIDGVVQSGDPVTASSEAVSFVLPAHAAGDVVLGVEDDLGNRAAASDPFRYLAFPVVGTLTPAAAPRTGGKEITVAGTDFAEDGHLYVDGDQVSFEFDGPQQIRFEAPARAAARVDVAFEDRFGQRGTLADGLRLFELADRTADAPAVVLQEDFGGEASLLMDFEGDGDLDLVVASPSAVNSGATPSTRVLRNDDGTFVNTTATAFPATTGLNAWTARALASSDLDGDGLPELLVGRDDGSASPKASSQLRILEANAQGSFADVTSSFLPGTSDAHDFRARAVAAGDLDGDGDTDVLVSSLTGFDYDLDGDTRHSAATRVLLQDDNGELVDSSANSLPDVTGADDDLRAVANLLADLDGDGDLDAVLLHTAGFSGASALRVLVNAGDGTFSVADGAVPGVSGEEWAGRSVVAADLDGDGDLDLALVTDSRVADDRASTRVLLNDGAGVFVDATGSALPVVDADSTERFEARAVRAADVDGDGTTDLVIAADPSSGSGPFTRVLLHDVGHRFTLLATAVPGTGADAWGASTLAVGDYDGDGDADLVLTGASQAGSAGKRTRVWRNEP